jgi:hypothetical protein
LIRLACRFRGVGTTWPLREGDTVEAWTGLRLVAEIPAELLIELIAHHLRGIALQDEFRVTVTPARKPLAPIVEAKQAARAAVRRSRRKLNA